MEGLVKLANDDALRQQILNQLADQYKEKHRTAKADWEYAEKMFNKDHERLKWSQDPDIRLKYNQMYEEQIHPYRKKWMDLYDPEWKPSPEAVEAAMQQERLKSAPKSAPPAAPKADTPPVGKKAIPSWMPSQAKQLAETSPAPPVTPQAATPPPKETPPKPLFASKPVEPAVTPTKPLFTEPTRQPKQWGGKGVLFGAAGLGLGLGAGALAGTFGHREQ